MEGYDTAEQANDMFRELQVHDQVGQDQRTARSMEDRHLAEPAATRDNRLLEVLGPCLGRFLAELMVEPHARPFDRSASAQVRCRSGFCVDVALPVFDEAPVHHVRSDDVPERTDRLENLLQAFAERRGRVQPELPGAKPDHGHPHRHLEPHHVDRLAVHDPDVLRDRLQAFEGG